MKLRKKKKLLEGHREKGTAVVKYPDGTTKSIPRNIAEALVENNSGYQIISTKPSKKPWR